MCTYRSLNLCRSAVSAVTSCAHRCSQRNRYSDWKQASSFWEMAFTFGSCELELQLFRNGLQSSFLDAQADCVSQGGQLFFPRDAGDMDRLRRFQLDQGGANLVRLGLIDNLGIGGISTDRFETIENQPSPFTSVTPGFFPWAILQPDDLFGEQLCVAMDIADFGLNDVVCESELEFVCERPCVVQPDDCIGGLKLSTDFVVTSYFGSKDNCEAIGARRLAIPSSSERLANINTFRIANGLANCWLGLEDLTSNPGGDPANTIRFIRADGRANGFTTGAPFVPPWTSGQPNDLNGEQHFVIVRGANSLLNDRENTLQLTSICEEVCSPPPVFDVGECVNGLQFYLGSAFKSFDEADLDCRTFDALGGLAVPDSQSKFDEMKAFLQSPTVTLEGFRTWIGLNDYFDEGGPLNFNRFLTVDGGINPFTNDPLPWRLTQPDDFLGNQNCGTIDNSELLLDDEACTARSQYLCERPCVPSPTGNPTISPSANPTASPSEGPTINPTISPSANPTVSPSENPTISPSVNPTKSPTGNPTINPSISPTVNPTISPSGSPTQNPTKTPTINPTISPTGSCTNGLDMFAITAPQTFPFAQSFCEAQGGTLALPSSTGRFTQINDELIATGISNAFVGLLDPLGNNQFGVTTRFLDLNGQINPFTSGPGFQFPWLVGTDPNALEGEDCILFRQNAGIGDINCFGAGLPFVCEKYCGELPEFVFGECVDNIEYYFSPELRTFDGAQTDCEAFDVTGQLAIPSDASRLSRISALFEANRPDNVDAFIGLRDFFEIGGTGTTRFIAMDLTVPEFTSGPTGVFPWAAGRPNDLEGIQDCGVIRTGIGQLDDSSCDQLHFSICERPCIPSPTINPTENPTISPSETPTSNPTQTPTGNPTASPSEGPTENPTISPSQGPTENPTVSPSQGPTVNPTISPSANPTVAPSQGPTVNPTISPSANPTANPTSIPSFNPTLNPSVSPTQNPSKEPTVSPTQAPTSDFIFGACNNNNLQLYLPISTASFLFDAAVDLCAEVGGRLAIPASIDRFNSILNFNAAFNRRLLIGLRDFADVGGRIATRFLGSNGQPNPFSHRVAISPWRAGEPNDSGSENCAELLSNLAMNDMSCATPRPPICERYCGVLPTFVVGQCIDDIQYYFNPEVRSFDGAQADCEAFDPIGRLAVPSSAERFDRINALYESNRGAPINAHLGLRDFFGIGGTDTSRFLSMDGDVLEFTSGLPGVFPWADGRPNDLEGTQDCVVIRAALGQIDDVDCNEPQLSVCERACVAPVEPTESPTAAPTDSPTISPTSNPTTTPTTNPSRSPTLSPSSNPTQNPTLTPTNSPTTSPTASPTLNPTVSPTSSPTDSPTFNPTTSPSFNPTVSPTSSPTISPTTSPSVNPTFNPTVSPTINPTLNPTVSPTFNPTVSPTLNPTKNPTKSPTFSPSKNPTAKPTVSPTDNPTVKPTSSPSRRPTVNGETFKPTVSPTQNPLVSAGQCSRRSFGFNNEL